MNTKEWLLALFKKYRSLGYSRIDASRKAYADIRLYELMQSSVTF